MIRKLFYEIFLKWYIRIYIFILLLAVSLNYLFSAKIYVSILYCICFTNLFVVISSYIIHRNLYNYVKDDINKTIKLATIHNVDRRIDIIYNILYMNNFIPENIITKDNNANKILNSIQKIPTLFDITFSFHDTKYLWFSWLKVDKSKNLDLIKKILPGDTILYHNNKSFLGKSIRLVTRCYWEHMAVYIGNGKIIEATLSGTIESSLLDWLESEITEIAILRNPILNNPSISSIFIDQLIKLKGIRYGFFKALAILWDIIINRNGLGIMTPLLLYTNIILLIICLLIVWSYPQFIILHIILTYLSIIFIYDISYNKVAYINDYSKLF